MTLSKLSLVLPLVACKGAISGSGSSTSSGSSKTSTVTTTSYSSYENI